MALALRSDGANDRRVIDDDIRVRRVEPGDAAELERLYAELCESSRNSRFLGRWHTVDSPSAAAFAAADHVRCDGFVAVQGRRVVGHLALEPLGGGIDELAIVVADRIRHRGVASLLMVAGLASARLRAIERVVAWVMAENRPARQLLESTNRHTRLFWEGAVARYEIEVPPVRPVASRC